MAPGMLETGSAIASILGLSSRDGGSGVRRKGPGGPSWTDSAQRLSPGNLCSVPRVGGWTSLSLDYSQGKKKGKSCLFMGLLWGVEQRSLEPGGASEESFLSFLPSSPWSRPQHFSRPISGSVSFSKTYLLSKSSLYAFIVRRSTPMFKWKRSPSADPSQTSKRLSPDKSHCKWQQAVGTAATREGLPLLKQTSCIKQATVQIWDCMISSLFQKSWKSGFLYVIPQFKKCWWAIKSFQNHAGSRNHFQKMFPVFNFIIDSN